MKTFEHIWNIREFSNVLNCFHKILVLKFFESRGIGSEGILGGWVFFLQLKNLRDLKDFQMFQTSQMFQMFKCSNVSENSASQKKKKKKQRAYPPVFKKPKRANLFEIWNIWNSWVFQRFSNAFKWQMYSKIPYLYVFEITAGWGGAPRVFRKPEFFFFVIILQSWKI